MASSAKLSPAGLRGVPSLSRMPMNASRWVTV
jgi:hypothetical protein